jgi:hypothetical protein
MILPFSKKRENQKSEDGKGDPEKVPSQPF